MPSKSHAQGRASRPPGKKKPPPLAPAARIHAGPRTNTRIRWTRHDTTRHHTTRHNVSTESQNRRITRKNHGRIAVHGSHGTVHADSQSPRNADTATCSCGRRQRHPDHVHTFVVNTNIPVPHAQPSVWPPSRGENPDAEPFPAPVGDRPGLVPCPVALLLLLLLADSTDMR